MATEGLMGFSYVRAVEWYKEEDQLPASEGPTRAQGGAGGFLRDSPKLRILRFLAEKSRGHLLHLTLQVL